MFILLLSCICCIGSIAVPQPTPDTVEKRGLFTGLRDDAEFSAKIELDHTLDLPVPGQEYHFNDKKGLHFIFTSAEVYQAILNTYANPPYSVGHDRLHRYRKFPHQMVAFPDAVVPVGDSFPIRNSFFEPEGFAGTKDPGPARAVTTIHVGGYHQFQGVIAHTNNVARGRFEYILPIPAGICGDEQCKGAGRRRRVLLKITRTPNLVPSSSISPQVKDHIGLDDGLIPVTPKQPSIPLKKHVFIESIPGPDSISVHTVNTKLVKKPFVPIKVSTVPPIIAPIISPIMIPVA